MRDEDDDLFGIEDASHLTDADWAEINRLKQAHQTGGQKAVSEAMEKLSSADPIRYMSVLAAFFPEKVREAIKDSLAEAGLDEDDVRDIIRKLESPARDQ